MTENKTGLYFLNLSGVTGEMEALLKGREEVGGKAQGLLSIYNMLSDLNAADFPGIELGIPPMTVIGTGVFEAFMRRNDLYGIALSNQSDEAIGRAFQKADMPFEILGELHNFSERMMNPLAVRSSGLLEDTTHRPFAGVYLTKMIPNNQYDAGIRFKKLIEAIKFVWASTYFSIAKDYCAATGLDIRDEKMAVIIQKMAGKRYHERFYPELSGVARSYNYYPVKPARPEHGVVDLALGLGKTIVDGGKSWTYSPAFPQMPPPFDSIQELLEKTQTEFWAVNMGEPPEYDPIKETEYMQLENIMTADRDDALQYLASTYNPQSDRLTMGIGEPGPRAMTFSPLLSLKEMPFNRLVKTLLAKCEDTLSCPVEIEFAMTFDPHRFSFLQVRPMAIQAGGRKVTKDEMNADHVMAASEVVLGNGCEKNIRDIVYVMPDKFDLKDTRRIADELENFNRVLLAEERPYLLVVFGRLGTLDPWLGIPVAWGQICGARVIVEATQENVKVELSQGSHYFHNIINLGVMYFCMPFNSPYRIDWKWLEEQQIVETTEFVRHVRLPEPLRVHVDGTSGRGVIYKSISTR